MLLVVDIFIFVSQMHLTIHSINTIKEPEESSSACKDEKGLKLMTTVGTNLQISSLFILRGIDPTTPLKENIDPF